MKFFVACKSKKEMMASMLNNYDEVVHVLTAFYSLNRLFYLLLTFVFFTSLIYQSLPHLVIIVYVSSSIPFINIIPNLSRSLPSPLQSQTIHASSRLKEGVVSFKKKKKKNTLTQSFTHLLIQSNTHKILSHANDVHMCMH